MLRSVFVLLLSLFVVSACGPERSSEDQKITEREENRKLDRDELLKRAEAQRPYIERWAGCYIGSYTNGNLIEVVISLREFVRLVTPGGSNSPSEPVEMPILRASLWSKRNPDTVVSFNTFDANFNASLVSFGSSNGSSLTLDFEPESGNHYGDYTTVVMGTREISLRPTGAGTCRL